jgi:hypothetical protein
MMSPTNCASLQKADAVFEGTVESIELVSPPPPPGTKVTQGSVWVGRSHHLVKLADLRPWRGEASPLVVTSWSETSCGYPFQQGERYLIVAHRDAQGRLSVSLCGQTRAIKAADGLIDYLKSLQSGNHTRVWGRVFKVTGDRNSTSVPDAIVTLNGPREVVAKTDADGRFVVTGIAAGKYSASAQVPSSNTVAEAIWPDFELAEGTPNACAELMFVVPASGGVTGIVLDERGEPLVQAFVTLYQGDPVVDPSRESGLLGQETNGEGRYWFSELPPGKYRVVLNDRGPSPMAPYLPTVALAPTGATTLSIGDGELVTLNPLVPKRLSKVTVNGTVRGADGSPIAGVEIRPWGRLPDNGRYADWDFPQPVSDAEGRFVLQLWKDQPYQIVVGTEQAPLAEVELRANGEPVSIVIPR